MCLCTDYIHIYTAPRSSDIVQAQGYPRHTPKCHTESPIFRGTDTISYLWFSQKLSLRQRLMSAGLLGVTQGGRVENKGSKTGKEGKPMEECHV